MGIPPLEGITVGITADRRAEEQAELLSRRGATVLHGPTIRTLPLGPDARLRSVTDELVWYPPDVTVVSTGVGVRGWLAVAESWGVADALVASLSRSRILCRGPKAAGALTTAGLRVDWRAPGEKMDDVVEHLLDHGVSGLRVAVQLDGDADSSQGDRLRRAGAEVVEIPVYRWTLPENIGPALRLIDATCAGRLDAVTFTAAPAVRNLFLLAEREGVADSLRHALSGRVLAMCVGPVCRAAADEHGITQPLAPARARLGSMVQALVHELGERRRVVDVGGRRVVLSGSVVAVDGEPVVLSGRERGVFEVLARRPGVVVSKPAVLAAVWGETTVGPHVIEVTVARLRKRLAPSGLMVETVVRRGYRLVPDEAPPATASSL